MLFFFLLSNYLSATPECPIVTSRFPLADGAVTDASATGWYLNATNVASTGYFAVKSNRLHAQELGGEGIWYSRVFSTAGYSDFQVAVKVSSEGDMNSSEYVKIYYKINGGAETLLDSRTGNFGTIDFTSGVLTGSNVQLIVKLYNYNNGGSQTSKYYIEEYRVFKEKGPCAVSTITATAAAANGGILTCANSPLGLSATATGSGTTTWSWSGPNGFTSTLQNPTVTAGGTYTVVATNSSGTGSASVTVTENKTAPVITATGGALACGSCVTISATSNVSNATYSWSGPGTFTSAAQNPTVCTAGTYTVTVTNPANGCSAQQSVSVTAGSSAAATFWLEDFAGLSNGTTSDAGTTAWTTSVTGSGTYSVQNNEYKVSFSGSQGVGIWTSQAINIASKTNVTFSVGLRSEVASSSDALENTDYIRVYYKLNGGAETLVFEDLAGIGSTTNTTGSTTFTSSTLNGSTLQIIIKTSNSDPTERYFFDNINVSGTPTSTGTVTITPAVNGTVTCMSTAQLSATASNTVSSWSWTGPNGFTSAQQNPVVNAGGQYIVTATLSSGCAASATITVPENKTLPDITATGGTLACLPSITLNANSTVSGVSYSWTGPNGFISPSKNPTVTTAGTYTVTVTNPANGCSNQQSVSVTTGSSTPATFWLEDFSDLIGGSTEDSGPTAWTATTSGSGTYSVQNAEFKTSFSGQYEGVWTSQAVNIAGKSNVNFSVDLRSEATTNNAFETLDYIRVYYKLNGGEEILAFEDFAGIGSTTTGTASTTFTSAALNGSTLQVIIKTNNSADNERYYFDNIKLTGSDISAETVTATGGVITCLNNASLTLSGNASSGGVSYSWTGPGNFTSAEQNPVVVGTGIYTLTVYNPATGCSGTDTALVTRNISGPNASASSGGSLSCSGNSSVTLFASPTSGVRYRWTGPNNFASTEQNPVVTTAGEYNLTVVSTETGCSSIATSVTVTMSSTSTGTIWSEGFTLPNGTTAGTGASSWSITTNPSTTLFSVLNNEMRISNSSTTGEGVWTSGAIDVTGKTNISISTNVRSSIINGAVMNTDPTYGDYIRFYYKLDNGAEVKFAEKTGIINNHSTTPTPVSITGLSGASSLHIVVRVRATGNDEFYYFDNVQVVATSQSALNAVATATDILSCTKNSVGLTGSSSATSPVNYSWTGPSNFTSTVQNPSAPAAGTYTLTVTDPSTGCTGSDTALVSLNNTPPGASASASGTITCNAGSSATLSGSSSTSGVSYSWTGPNNFTSAAQNPVVTAAGTYNLTVTNPVNGCTSAASATLTLNNTLTSTWLEDFTLANGTTSDAGATAWTTSKTVSAAVIAVQNNELRITNCTTTGDVVWTSAALDMTGKTSISISAGVKSSIINNAVMNTDPTYGDYIRFYYKLNNGNEVLFAEKTAGINNHSTTLTPVSVTVPNGNYSTIQVVVRARATGNDEFYYVDNMQVVATGTANITASATGGTINCNNNSVTLQGSAATSGATYTWSGPDGYTSTAQNPAVTKGGTYTLTVALGGCTGTAAATVIMDTTKPNITASATPVQLTCTATPAILSGGSATQGVTYSWSNANGVIAITASTSVVDPGTYTLTVNNPANGCTAAKQVIVTQNITPPPAITVSHLGRVTCDSPTAMITGTVSPGLNYKWTGPEGFTANTLTTEVRRGGTYTLTATDPVNGCPTSASTEVAENTTTPTGLSITNPGSITCLITEIPLIGYTVTPNATYKWTGPGDFTSSSLEVMVSMPGDYKLIVTDTINGCSADVTTTVIDNAQPPVITIINTSPLSCSNRVVKLQVITNTANAEILWTGPGGFFSTTDTTSTSVPGKYNLLVADPENGCSTKDFTTVTGRVSGCAREATNSDNTATVNAQNAPDEAITKFAYKAYPNPVITNGIIEFTSPQSTTATVSIYNALGACEKVLFKGAVMANRVNRVPVSAQQLSTGAYYYIINTGGKSFTGKLVIMK